MVLGMLIGALVTIILVLMIALALPEPDLHFGPVASSWSQGPTP